MRMARTSDDQDVVDSLAKQGEAKHEWILKIFCEQPSRIPSGTAIPRIQKVIDTLRDAGDGNEKCFDPSVVPLGPLHHHQIRFNDMVSRKAEAARWFLLHPIGNIGNRVQKITEMKAKMFYDKFVEVATSILLSSPKDYYDEDSIDNYSEEELMQMMFLDGCFILHFIYLFDEGSDDTSILTSHLHHPEILKDIFLLENQIPFGILKALMSLKPEYYGEDFWRIKNFISRAFIPPPSRPRFGVITIFTVLFKDMFFYFGSRFLRYKDTDHSIDSFWNESANKSEPIHLLGLLRSRLVGTSAEAASTYPRRSGSLHYHFRSIRELEETGILVSRSSSSLLIIDVKFRNGLINSHLELPQIIVDDSTKALLLNLAAFEMSPDFNSNGAITSYICFLDSLINHAEDVNELRSRNILLNRLGSDKEVVVLFKALAIIFSPGYNTYSDVLNGIHRHRHRHFNHIRLWTGQLVRSHFSSPWSAISLLAAVFIIALTVLQTIYTILGYVKA